MQFEPKDTATLIELMRWRRDVRHFTDRPVPDASLATLRQSLTLAPSVGNSQPWRIVNVMSHDVRQQIIADHTVANEVAASVYNGDQRVQYEKLKLAALEEAPVQLAVFTEVAPLEGHGLGRQTMPETLFYSSVLAIHGLWLTARSLNLGVGWVSILNAADIERILQVPPTWQLTAYLCIGYPKFSDDTPELERVGWQDGTEVVWLDA